MEHITGTRVYEWNKKKRWAHNHHHHHYYDHNSVVTFLIFLLRSYFFSSFSTITTQLDDHHHHHLMIMIMMMASSHKEQKKTLKNSTLTNTRHLLEFFKVSFHFFKTYKFLHSFMQCNLIFHWVKERRKKKLCFWHILSPKKKKRK